MVAAAAAGAAPPVLYCDPATGVVIMDFVSSRPFQSIRADLWAWRARSAH